MKKVVLDSKIKILIGVLVVGILLIGTWQALERCVEKEPIVITTANGIERYVNQEVMVIGVLHCIGSKVPCSIEFDDGTSLALSTDISDTGYGDKRVSLIARVYQCRPPAQCYGIILTDITFVNLIEEEKVVADPFENLPQPAQPNCDPEYRFKFDGTINSKDDFILFLKTHQFQGDLLNYKPTEDRLIPSNTYNQNQIDLDKLKTNVEIYKVENSKLSNKKIYILRIRNQDFNENWPWMITVIMSDKAYVSIRCCAGI